MKVLLLKDVYKLGRAGDIKKVADGYGRNFLIPKRFAVLATEGAVSQVEHIKAKAEIRRAEINNEMGGIAEKLNGLVLAFASKAGETGKLYGSVTTQNIADEINKKIGFQVDRHAIEIQPIRFLGDHKAVVRLTVDLTPEIKVIVHREGEKPVLPKVETPVEEGVIEDETLVEEDAVEVETPVEEEIADNTAKEA